MSEVSWCGSVECESVAECGSEASCTSVVEDEAWWYYVAEYYCVYVCWTVV